MDKDFYRTAAPDRYGHLKMWARENRNHMTDAERHIWHYLRGNQLGFKFLRQHIIADYIVDYVCLEKKLIIEIDGGYHSEPHQQDDDAMRTKRLNSLGFRVIRFTNEEILTDLLNTLSTIKEHLNE